MRVFKNYSFCTPVMFSLILLAFLAAIINAVYSYFYGTHVRYEDGKVIPFESHYMIRVTNFRRKYFFSKNFVSVARFQPVSATEPAQDYPFAITKATAGSHSINCYIGFLDLSQVPVELLYAKNTFDIIDNGKIIGKGEILESLLKSA